MSTARHVVLCRRMMCGRVAAASLGKLNRRGPKADAEVCPSPSIVRAHSVCSRLRLRWVQSRAYCRPSSIHLGRRAGAQGIVDLLKVKGSAHGLSMINRSYVTFQVRSALDL